RPRLEVLDGRLAPAVHTWIPAGGSNNWSDPANWSGGVPAAGEADVSLIFSGRLFRDDNGFMESKNDITGLTVGSIQFTEQIVILPGTSYSTPFPGFKLTGNPIAVVGGSNISEQATANLLDENGNVVGTTIGVEDSISLTVIQQPAVFHSFVDFSHTYEVDRLNSLEIDGQLSTTG